MIEVIKKQKWALTIGSAIILLPMLAGALLWDRLPDPMATHWGISGEPNGWTSRAFTVFGIPLVLLAMQWLCLTLDRTNIHNRQNKKVITLILWIIPAVSVFMGISVYGYALNYDAHVETVAPLLVGVMFIFVGNYLPKCTQNYTTGIKLPWTFESEANWNATHRFAGKVWVAAGALMLVCVLLPKAALVWIALPAIFAAVLIPVVYSYLFARRERASKEGGEV